MRPPAVHSPGFAFVVGTTSLAFVVGQLDVTIVNVALPRMASEFSASVATLQWVVDAYALTFAVFMLSAGALGDRFGSRRGFIAGIGIFGLASLACALAGSGPALIAARALQGLGAAAMLPNSLALLNSVFSDAPEVRARAVGWWTAAGAISIAAGPLLGGVLLDTLGWRSIFYVNLPLCAAGMWLATRLPETLRHSRGKTLDIRGQLVAMTALTLLTAAVIEAKPMGLGHPLVWGGFALACLLGAVFVRIQASAQVPTVPLDLFRNPTFNAAVLFGVAVNSSYYGTLFVLTLYLQRVLGYTPLHAGLAFLPLTAGFFFSNIVSGRLTARFGVRLPMLLGAAIDICGFLLLLRADGESSYASLCLAFLLIPSGMGLAVPAMTTTVLSCVDKRRAGTASAILNAARQAAGAMGVAVFGALADGAGGQIVQGLHVTVLLSVVLIALAGWRVFNASVRGKSGIVKV